MLLRSNDDVTEDAESLMQASSTSRALAIAAVTLSLGLLERSAAAQPAAPQPSAVDPAPNPIVDPVTPLSPQKTQEKPPTAPSPVPSPSPVVVGGEPTAPGTAVQPLVWRRARFKKWEYYLTVGAGLVTLGSAIVSPMKKHAIGPILFDDDVRTALRETSLQKRYTFRDASDVGLSLTATWPFFVDALVTAWWYRGSRDTAEQMALIDLETLAISGAIQGVTNVLVSRERPYGEQCRDGALPTNAFDCEGSSHYRSFFSGHTAFSFTSAALVCFHHMEQHLLGGPWDAISCGGAYAVAAATGTFRMVGDMHYASDVIAGALIGTAVGYGVPLLHTRHPEVGEVKTTGMTMRIVPSGMGAGVAGIF